MWIKLSKWWKWINLVSKKFYLNHYYVFNFGSLEPEDEIKYISSIVSKLFEEEEKLKEKTEKAIIKCHEYLRKTIDPLIVSLRDLQNVLIFYELLSKKIKIRNEKYDKIILLFFLLDWMIKIQEVILKVN